MLEFTPGINFTLVKIPWLDVLYMEKNVYKQFVSSHFHTTAEQL